MLRIQLIYLTQPHILRISLYQCSPRAPWPPNLLGLAHGGPARARQEFEIEKGRRLLHGQLSSRAVAVADLLLEVGGALQLVPQTIRSELTPPVGPR